MATTKDRVMYAADTAKPYLGRALTDEEFRDNLRAAFAAARAIYEELSRQRGDLVDRRQGHDGRGHPEQSAPRDQGAPPGGGPHRGTGGARVAHLPERLPPDGRDRDRHLLQPLHRPGHAPLGVGEGEEGRRTRPRTIRRTGPRRGGGPPRGERPVSPAGPSPLRAPSRPGAARIDGLSVPQTASTSANAAKTAIVARPDTPSSAPATSGPSGAIASAIVVRTAPARPSSRSGVIAIP